MKKLISWGIDWGKRHMEIVSYLFFGVAATAVNWIAYIVCLKLFSLDITPSNVVAWVAAVIFAFFTNKFFVFRSKSTDLLGFFREFLTFVGARVFSGLIEMFLPELLVNAGFDAKFWGIDGFWAKAAVSVIVIVTNYVLSKLIVFRKKKTDKDSKQL